MIFPTDGSQRACMSTISLDALPPLKGSATKAPHTISRMIGGAGHQSGLQNQTTVPTASSPDGVHPGSAVMTRKLGSGRTFGSKKVKREGQQLSPTS